MFLHSSVIAHHESVVVSEQGSAVVVSNGQVTLFLKKTNGLYDLVWDEHANIKGAFAEAKDSSLGILRAIDYGRHEIEKGDVERIKDRFGSGIRITERHTAAGKPELRQIFWIYEGKPELFERLELVGPAGVSSNYLAPIGGVDSVSIEHRGPLQSLFVPWDNDNYFRFRSDGWGEGEGDGDGSYEVGSVYDDSTRNGLIIGSIDHDLWKSAIRFKRKSDGKLEQLRVYSGVSSKYTHDTQPHGAVSGQTVSSARFVFTWNPDWRKGLERFGDLNAIVKPALSWNGSVPFGWNSWSGHKEHIDAAGASAATEFVLDKLPYLRSNHTATINFDAGSGNLSTAQMDAFIKRAHSIGFKAGIYWTPFACWAGLDQKRDDAPGTFRDLVLKDDKGNPLPKIDGAYPFDPSNPGVLSRIDAQIKRMVDQGFDYVKMDFISHGALEAKHFDPKIQTGTAAYSLGMQRIVDDLSPKKIGRPFFISLSIAPMFPHGYAHARRISCDIFANIGASEYLLNSTNYGWWPGGRLYRFNDADSVCVYQPLGEPPVSEAEARTRFTASTISGGMMIQGDNLTKPEAEARVLKLFSNREILDLARRSPGFWPVEGTTNYAAGDSFVWHDRGDAYMALFNFDKTKPKTKRIPFDRLGLAPGSYTARNLWTGQKHTFQSEISAEIAPMDCWFVKLTKD